MHQTRPAENYPSETEHFHHYKHKHLYHDYVFHNLLSTFHEYSYTANHARLFTLKSPLHHIVPTHTRQPTPNYLKTKHQLPPLANNNSHLPLLHEFQICPKYNNGQLRTLHQPSKWFERSDRRDIPYLCSNGFLYAPKQPDSTRLTWCFIT